MKFRDRIKGFKKVKASDLKANPKNFRTHDAEQTKAMQTVMDEVGFVGYTLARETEDGSLMLLDGHLRKSLSGDEMVPCVILDVDEAEADVVLATFDQIREMADTDDQALNELITSIEDVSGELDVLLDSFTSKEALEIGGAGEKYESDEKMRFRRWNLPMSQETAELLNTKVMAYMEEYSTLVGLGERMLDALEK